MKARLFEASEVVTVCFGSSRSSPDLRSGLFNWGIWPHFSVIGGAGGRSGSFPPYLSPRLGPIRARRPWDSHRARLK